MTSFVFETAPRIICEQGGIQRLGALALDLGMQRVFLVTDAGLIKAGLQVDAIQALSEAGLSVTVYSDVAADPPEGMVEAAVAAAIAAKVDGIVGIGGGSSMDTAKLVALLACSPQALEDVYGVDRARGPRFPLIQIPTTAGTGSEVTPISVVTTATQEKKGVVSSLLYPDLALLDSQLTLALPPAITAMTGVDAMVHAIEAFTSKHKKNAFSDALSVKALQLLFKNIDAAVIDGSDANVRENMLVGSLLAGMAFANAPVGAVHALAYPLGGHYHLPHGLCNSLMLNAVLEFNFAEAERLYASLGRAILPGLGQVADRQTARAFVDAMAKKVSIMPYAQSLGEVGITEKDLPMLARDAMQVQRLLQNNPREVSETDALALYRAAL
ncbi:iron-containing alcohol dehydrogenase [Massilia sp. CMS3.1]|uniref:iron-containing alcohol dehydrogenase n=1 Tax=Massilia sp. CMS3.1 TaxID=3373083 RepID=UPI003EE77430